MLELDFAIVDPHVHHWDPYTTPRPSTPLAKLLRPWPELYVSVASKLVPGPLRGFVGSTEYVLTPYLPADRARDAGALRTESVVHVEAGWVGFSALAAVDETRWLQTLPFEASGTRLGAIVAHANLRSPHVAAVMDAHASASAKLRGIRHMASKHSDAGVHAWCKRAHLFTDAAFLRGFEQLADRKLRFDAWVYSEQLPDVIALADRFPEVPIVLDHLGTPVGAAGPVASTGHTPAERERIIGDWREQLARVAERKNVFAKISGLVMPVVGFGFHTRPVRPNVSELMERLRPFVRHALQVFGVERCFFASNFPMDKVSASYEDLFSAYAQLAAEHGPQAPRALLRDNALRFYGI